MLLDLADVVYPYGGPWAQGGLRKRPLRRPEVLYGVSQVTVPVSVKATSPRPIWTPQADEWDFLDALVLLGDD